MPLEFRTRDESYNGPSILPSGAVIPQASVFVDHLPPGFSTDPYNPYLTNDRYCHQPRYVIDAKIMVHSDVIGLVEISTNGLGATNPETAQLIANTSIERDGLDILLTHRGGEYQGVLYPIPELRAAAPQQHRARHRH